MAVLFPINLEGALEALLFVSPEPLPLKKIAQTLELSLEETREVVLRLQDKLNEDQRGIMLNFAEEEVWLTTRPDFSVYIERLFKPPAQHLTQATLETLAIIAYKQPVTKTEIELIRGVKADSSIATLLERGLIEEAGRKEAPGRPILYRTTAKFLEFFGLKSLEELPPLNLENEPENDGNNSLKDKEN
ncbi:SMC-Scp complex subunit ScpB [Carboxydothermus pertinax]|uniref:Segregation and condensation protein B n=1 Tax=Carboxydothermus pertinax TaxID=870242 RepID=A0A1L8CTR6_9THEO|nr:SMC-Scp complex subunit ScpB [Carboxydothermus pertinax]GAV22320.1 segregation and condensation protein B [Carboxydothermus pertinax]